MAATLYHAAGQNYLATFTPVSSQLGGVTAGDLTVIWLLNNDLISGGVDFSGFGAGGAIQAGLIGGASNRFSVDPNDSGNVTVNVMTAAKWFLVAFTRIGTLTHNVRWHWKNLTDSGSWVHETTAAAAWARAAGPGTSGQWKIGYGGDWGNGGMAYGLNAVWATGLSDAQMEALSPNGAGTGQTSDIWDSAAGNPITLIECTSTSPSDIGANPSTFSACTLLLTGDSPPWTFDGQGGAAPSPDPATYRVITSPRLV